MSDSMFHMLNSHFDVSRETFEKLSIYHDLLIKWQSKINLISNDTKNNIWNRHFLDSLQLIKFAPDKNITAIDIGTGAGFPGMALAIAGFNDIRLIESDGKKVVFLKEISRLTDTKITIHHDRAENVIVENCGLLLSRACSDLDKLLQVSHKNVSRETTSLFHKGKNYSIELDKAKKHWSFNQEIITSITDPNGVIVKLSNIQRCANGTENHSKPTK